MILKLPKKRHKFGVFICVALILWLESGAFATGIGSDYTQVFESVRHLRFGHKGEDVRQLQRLLSELGSRPLSLDGHFGNETQTAVMDFQKNLGLFKDGIVGPETKLALRASYEKLKPPSEHKVSAGETLAVIASRYGLSIAYLISLNNLENPDRIFPGDVLTLSNSQTEARKRDTPIEEPLEEVLPPMEILPAPDKGICLTFNDGPDPDTTPEILKILDEYGIKATFFVIGEKVRRHPELLKQVAERGHVLGVHGYEHKVLAGLGPKDVRTDLQMAQSCVFQVSGQKPYLYRPPHGILDGVQVEEAQKLDMKVLMWTNIGGADLGANSPQEVCERVLAAARDGSIILLHEGFPNSYKALRELIPSLARLGFGFQNPSPSSFTGPGRER